MKRVVRTSERITFKRCRRKWYFSSPNKLNLEPNIPAKPLWLGTGIHLALAALYSGYDPIKEFEVWAQEELRVYREKEGELWVEEEEAFAQEVELGIGMLEHYLTYVKDQDEGTTLEVEHKFELPIPHPETGNPSKGIYQGRSDRIFEDHNGLYWIQEHKTAKQFRPEILDLDEQISSYIWAEQKNLGIKIEGVIFNVLRKKLPVIPKLLKNGELSKATSMDTTSEVYQKTLAQHGLSPEPYKPFIQYLQDKGNNFFMRRIVRRSQEEIQDIQRRIYYEYRDMFDPHVTIYPNPSFDCSYCVFYPVCLAMNDGSDWQGILRANYREKED